MYVVRERISGSFLENVFLLDSLVSVSNLLYFIFSKFCSLKKICCRTDHRDRVCVCVSVVGVSVVCVCVGVCGVCVYYDSAPDFPYFFYYRHYFSSPSATGSTSRTCFMPRLCS
jgi:hypothetical protein